MVGQKSALSSLRVGHRTRHRRVLDGPEESVETRCLRGPHCTIGEGTGTVTSTHPRDAWREETVGHDRALVRRDDAVEMAFGLGPAIGAAREPSRLTAILDNRIQRLRYCDQIHGQTIHEVSYGGLEVMSLGPGDGLVTTAPGTALLVWTADCGTTITACRRLLAISTPFKTIRTRSRTGSSRGGRG